MQDKGDFMNYKTKSNYDKFIDRLNEILNGGYRYEIKIKKL